MSFERFNSRPNDTLYMHYICNAEEQEGYEHRK